MGRPHDNVAHMALDAILLLLKNTYNRYSPKAESPSGYLPPCEGVYGIIYL